MLQRTSSPRTCLANAVPISSSSSSCELALPHALIYGTTITITTKLINSSPVIATPKFHNPPPLLIIHTAFPSSPQERNVWYLGGVHIHQHFPYRGYGSICFWLPARKEDWARKLFVAPGARLSLLFFFHGTSHKVASWPS